MAPTRAHGKICHIEIPAGDLHRSAEFYEHVFGWQIKHRGVVRSPSMTRPTR